MKKRILSVAIIVLCLMSLFAVSNSAISGPDAPLNDCTNEECDAKLNAYDKFCSKCGTEYVKPEEEEICQVCKDDNIETTYCPACGRQIEKKMKFKLDFGALGESAMILCKGMLGIFIVTGVIIAFILILNTVVEKVKQSKENKENE